MVNTSFPPSSLALGTAQWGMSYGVANTHGQPDRAEIGRLLELGRSSDITTLDTARAYGTSEEVLGELAAGHAWRIVTKLDPQVYVPGMGWPEVKARVEESLAASRHALGRKVLDTVLVHRSDHRTVLGGSIWSALGDDRSAGRIRQIGVSADSAEAAWAALDDPGVQVLQVATSLLDLRLWRAGFFDQAREAGVDVFVRSVFLQGVAFLPPERLPPAINPLSAPLSRVRTWASQHGTDVYHVFLTFLRDTISATLLVGCETTSQLEALIDAWNIPALPDIREVTDLIPDLDDAALSPARWRTPQFA
jgi:aryl-alcohol dehydrogenase-like predicted oxidoreductase